MAEAEAERLERVRVNVHVVQDDPIVRRPHGAPANALVGHQEEVALVSGSDAAVNNSALGDGGAKERRRGR